MLFNHNRARFFLGKILSENIGTKREETELILKYKFYICSISFLEHVL